MQRSEANAGHLPPVFAHPFNHLDFVKRSRGLLVFPRLVQRDQLLIEFREEDALDRRTKDLTHP